MNESGLMAGREGLPVTTVVGPWTSLLAAGVRIAALAATGARVIWPLAPGVGSTVVVVACTTPNCFQLNLGGACGWTLERGNGREMCLSQSGSHCLPVQCHMGIAHGVPGGLRMNVHALRARCKAVYRHCNLLPELMHSQDRTARLRSNSTNSLCAIIILYGQA